MFKSLARKCCCKKALIQHKLILYVYTPVFKIIYSPAKRGGKVSINVVKVNAAFSSYKSAQHFKDRLI